VEPVSYYIYCNVLYNEGNPLRGLFVTGLSVTTEKVTGSLIGSSTLIIYEMVPVGKTHNHPGN